MVIIIDALEEKGQCVTNTFITTYNQLTTNVSLNCFTSLYRLDLSTENSHLKSHYTQVKRTLIKVNICLYILITIIIILISLH